ncbi:hypothetical protein D9M68_706810 [compost metagenome]
MDRVPEWNGQSLAAELLHILDAGGHGQARSADVVPGHHFGWHLAAVTGPDGHWRQQVDDVDLTGKESFDHLGPATQQYRAFGMDALSLEEAVVVGHQQGRSIGDRQVSDAHWRIRFDSCSCMQRVQQRQCSCGSEQCAEFEEVTTRMGRIVQAHGKAPAVR